MINFAVKKSNLLILKGIDINDFGNLDDIYKSQKPSKPQEIYSDIPSKFTSPDKWIDRCNIKCWFCDKLFTDYPRFIARGVSRQQDENGVLVDTWDVFGVFHRWNCAQAYIELHFPRQQQDLSRYLCIVESKFTGRRRHKIMPSPPKTIMKQYCGNLGLTPHQYDEKIDKLEEEYELSSCKIDQLKFGNKDV